MANSLATAAPVSNGSATRKRQAPSAQQNNQRERRKARGGAHNVSLYVMPCNLQPTLGNSSGLSGEGLTYTHNEGGNLASFIRINAYEQWLDFFKITFCLIFYTCLSAENHGQCSVSRVPSSSRGYQNTEMPKGTSIYYDRYVYIC